MHRDTPDNKVVNTDNIPGKYLIRLQKLAIRNYHMSTLLERQPHRVDTIISDIEMLKPAYSNPKDDSPTLKHYVLSRPNQHHTRIAQIHHRERPGAVDAYRRKSQYRQKPGGPCESGGAARLIKDGALTVNGRMPIIVDDPDEARCAIQTGGVVM
ncbi:hypothetical protein CBL_12060 [Carabus blaptoides fortunei]